MTDQAVAPAASIEDRLAKVFAEKDASPEVPEQQEAAPVEAEETAETVTEEPEAPEQPGEEQQPEAETLAEVEVDGKVLKVSPEAKDYLMRHADYTRKTMELAEHRKLFQKEQEISSMQAAYQKEIEPESRELNKLEAQIEQFKQLKWHELDTDQIVRARQTMDDLKDQKQDLEKKLDGKREEFVQRQAEAKRQLLQHGNEYLSKTVPSWGTKAQQAAAQGALNVGFTSAEVSNFMDPRAVHLAWKAAQWDALQASKPQVANKVSKVPPVTKPGSPATTESQASKQYQELRQKVKKTGDLRDVAALFALRRK